SEEQDEDRPCRQHEPEAKPVAVGVEAAQGGARPRRGRRPSRERDVGHLDLTSDDDAASAAAPPSVSLKRDDLSLNRHPALACSLIMIFSENRYPLFGIML